MKVPLVTTAVFLAVALFVAVALSQEKAAEPTPDVKALIEKLASPDFAVREKAEKEILALGEKALPELRTAAESHEDTHVRHEAERLLNVLGAKGRERPLAEREPGDRPGGDPARERDRRFEETLRRAQESGLLDAEALDRLRRLLERRGGLQGRLPGLTAGVTRGVLQNLEEKIEYERDEEGRIKVRVTRDGETKTYEAGSLDELHEKAPDVYAKVAPHLGRIRISIRGPIGGFDFPFPGWPAPRRSPLTSDPRDRGFGRVPGGFRLGVWVGEISEPLRVHLKLEKGEGVLVEEVVPGSLADRTGVKRLDVIRSLNGVRIGAADGIRRAIAGVAEGGKVELAVIRKGDPLLLHGTR